MLANFLNLIPGVSVELPPIVEDRPKTELKKYIAKVADGCDLTLEEAQDAMDIIMSGSATNAQIAGLLVALRMKGETIDEITGFAKGMRTRQSTSPAVKSPLRSSAQAATWQTRLTSPPLPLS
ncbi:MAG: hypothetical protein ACLUOF_08560 [Ruminococcus sp.]